MGKPKLLWVSDHPGFSFVGQSRVTREFCSRLKENFDISILGFNTPLEDDPRTLRIKDFPIYSVPRTEKGVNITEFGEVIKKLDFDIMLLSHDPFLFPFLGEVRSFLPKTKIVGYYTIDGDPVPRAWGPAFHSCDLILVPTKYGKRVVREEFIDIDIRVVPYGMDHDNFKLLDRNAAKKAVTETTASQLLPLEFENKFVAIYYGHNQSKKNLIAARDGWAKFTTDKDDTLFLMIVHSRIANVMGWKIVVDHELTDFYRIKNLVAVEGYLSDSDLGKMLNASDALIFPSIGEGFGLPCVPPLTPVITPSGEKFVEDIEVGDYVKTHLGNNKLVLETFKRKFEGSLVEIKTLGTNEALRVTPNHELLVVSGDFENIRGGDFILQWKPASDVTKTDWLTYPTPQYNEIDIKKFNVREITTRNDLVEKNGLLYLKFSNQTNKVTAKTMAPKLNVTADQVYDAMWDTMRTYPKAIALKERIDKEFGLTMKSTIPSTFTCSEQFMKLCGYYVSEGCGQDGMVTFSFHKNEVGLHSDVENAIKDIFGLKVTFDYDKNGVEIVCSSGLVSNVFVTQFGKGAKNKRLPNWVMHLPHEKKRALVQGMWYGDGCLKELSYCTASRTLALQTRDLLLSLGFPVSVRHHRETTPPLSIVYDINIATTHQNEFAKFIKVSPPIPNSFRKTHSKIMIHKGYLLLRVREVKRIPYNGDVYNLKVKDDESYICRSFVTHNCLEAMACGTVPISTFFAGPTDYLHNKNSMPLYDWTPMLGQFGVLRAIANPHEIARKLQTLYGWWKTNDPLLTKMRETGVSTASNFTWDYSAHKMKEVLNMVLKREPINKKTMVVEV